MSNITLYWLKGGSWYDIDYCSRLTEMIEESPNVREFDNGFRVVKGGKE